jgi:hypothetical protein
MEVIINTKSNFRNLNGTKQKVYEVVGCRVTCLVHLPEFNKEVQVDFSTREVEFV